MMKRTRLTMILGQNLPQTVNVKYLSSAGIVSDKATVLEFSILIPKVLSFHYAK